MAESREVIPGVRLFSIPSPTGEEKLKLEGWREGIEEHGQDLWRIYHWIVHVQSGSAAGIYRLRDWLQEFNVADQTNGAHWRSEAPCRHHWIDAVESGEFCDGCGLLRAGNQATEPTHETP